jgi:hypothetical protein
MALYTKNGSVPGPLPYRIRLSDGSTRTDPSTFTPEEIAEAGYTVADSKPFPGQYEEVIWDGSSWQIVPYSAAKMQELVEEHIVQIAKDRFAKESEPITWTDSTGNTYVLDNTFDSQQRLVSAQAAISAGLRQDGGVWKCAHLVNGNVSLAFRPTTNSEIGEWANLAVNQVQTCFEVEAVCVNKVMNYVANADYANAFSVNYFVEYTNI